MLEEENLTLFKIDLRLWALLLLNLLRVELILMMLKLSLLVQSLHRR